MALGLLAHGLAVRILPEENIAYLRGEAMDTKKQLPQLETYNKVEQQMEEAPDLYINDRPRLKRVLGCPL